MTSLNLLGSSSSSFFMMSFMEMDVGSKCWVILVMSSVSLFLSSVNFLVSSLIYMAFSSYFIIFFLALCSAVSLSSNFLCSLSSSVITSVLHSLAKKGMLICLSNFACKVSRSFLASLSYYMTSSMLLPATSSVLCVFRRSLCSSSKFLSEYINYCS